MGLTALPQNWKAQLRRLGAMAAGLWTMSCLDPTQVTVEITTDALCEDLSSTYIVVGALGALQGRAPSATTNACDKNGRIGDVVVTPQKKKDTAFAVEVFVGVTTDTRRCAENDYEGCIVARRALNFIPRTPLELPIQLEIECLDVPCEATQTCRKGQCVSATLDNPLDCTDPAGCSGEVQGSGSGGNSSGGASAAGGNSSGGNTSGNGGSASGGNTSSSGGSSSGGETSTGGMGGQAMGTGGQDMGTGGAPPLPVGNAHLAIVTTAEDVLDAPGSTLSDLASDPGPDGFVSLREAIQAANQTVNDAVPDIIEFAIPGEGTHTIAVTDPGLPAIVDPVDIDGFSQEPNMHRIALDGTLRGNGAGLTFSAGSNTSSVSGLVIVSFEGAGIYIGNSSSVTVQSCYVGVGFDGMTDQGNGLGIHIHKSSGNVIGGSHSSTPKDTNVVSGNAGQGIMLTGAASTGNVIQGNLVGLDASGSIAVGNGLAGVEIKDGASGNIIGSASLAARNVISANGTHGVRILGRNGGAHDNIVQGNFIGSDFTYSTNATLGNNQSGVRILRDAQRNLVGGTTPGQGNRITYNGASGIRVGEGGTLPGRAALLGNWLSHNGELGIDLFDLDPDFVTLNDPGDSDAGTNSTQNFPEFTSVSFAGGEATVNFTLDTLPGNYRIEFFASAAADNICAVDPFNAPACLDGPGGVHYHGEGEFFVAALQVTVGGGGPEPFQAKVPMSAAQFISATCTPIISVDEYGGTSEFSRTVPTTFP